MFSSLNRTPAFQSLLTIGLKKYGSIQFSTQFETVFSLPSIKYISIMNRLKVYHILGTTVLLPSCGAMEMANIIPETTFLTAAYIGFTGAAVLTLASAPFRNVIGFLYISEDNKQIKISSVDFWGKRRDRIIKADEWIPLSDVKSKNMDALYLTPELTDGTKYKWLVRFGNVLNSRKIGEVLDLVTSFHWAVAAVVITVLQYYYPIYYI